MKHNCVICGALCVPAEPQEGRPCDLYCPGCDDVLLPEEHGNCPEVDKPTV